MSAYSSIAGGTTCIVDMVASSHRGHCCAWCSASCWCMWIMQFCSNVSTRRISWNWMSCKISARILKLTFILASALLAMCSTYIGQLMRPAAAPLIVRKLLIRLSNHLYGHYPLCYFVHRHLNNS